MTDFKYTVTEDDQKQKLRMRELIRRNFSFSARLRTKIKKNRSVYLNGRRMEPWDDPEAGDVMTIIIPDEHSNFTPEDISIDVLYEDDDLLIINKQPGIVVHPTKGAPAHTIANGVMKYMEDTGQSFKIRFINRLDMDTSGVLVMGKNSHVQDSYVKLMKQDMISKEYIALVRGRLEADTGIIDAPIGHPDPDSICRGVTEDGRECRTLYKVIERFSGYTYLSLKLETGRTHQIRVHMSHIGHPVVSDRLYGGGQSDWEIFNLIERQALHACRLVLPHPVTGRHLDISAPLPEDIKTLLDRLRSAQL